MSPAVTLGVAASSPSRASALVFLLMGPKQRVLLGSASKGSLLFRSSSARRNVRLLSSISSTTDPSDVNISDGAADDTRRQPTTRLISYLTDVEGDRDYLTRFVQQSRVLRFGPAKPRAITAPGHIDRDAFPFPYDHRLEFQSADDLLVFGGDAWDQGGADLYVLRQLLDLKARHPDRVRLVAGNRDVNKLRIARELRPDPTTGRAPPHAGAYWLRGTGREGDPASGQLLSDDPVQRLRWMLRETMGSPRAFEYRRLELERERLEAGQSDPVTDMDVVESYLRSTDPACGEMSLYLSQAELAVKLGDVLFLHGALPLTPTVIERHGDSKESIWSDPKFAMPWLPPGVRGQCDTLYEWFAALNNFLHDSVAAWKAMADGYDPQDDPLWATVGGYRPFPCYSNLVQYGMGGLPGAVRGGNPTVIYQSWATDGMPRRFFDASDVNNRRYVRHVRDFFHRAGVRLLVCGHQPQGDAPSAIRVDLPKSSPAFVVCADTSYSGDTKWHVASSSDSVGVTRQNLGREGALSGRGPVAVAEVLVEQALETARVVDVAWHGRLSDGTPYATHGLFEGANTDRDTGTVVVGTVAPEPLAPPVLPVTASPWWTRAALTDGSFLLGTGKGFDAWNCLVRPK